MPLVALLATAVLPPLIEQTGKTLRKWLTHRVPREPNAELAELDRRLAHLELKTGFPRPAPLS